MPKNELPTSNSGKVPANLDRSLCKQCGGLLNLVGNRRFLLYRRVHLPQPSTQALVCEKCGGVEGDPEFAALLAEFIKPR